MRRSLRQHQSGFTLLEAIVALVIISGAGLALFSLINTSVASLGRVQAVNARSEAVTNTIEYMQTVNPMLQPDGEAEFGAYRVRWHAELINPPQDGVGYPTGINLYQFALYKTHLEAATSTEPHWFELDLKLVGYKKVRDMVTPFGPVGGK